MVSPEVEIQASASLITKIQTQYCMLYGKNLILATKPYTQEFRSKSWAYVISTFSLLLIFLSVTTFVPNIYVKIPCGILVGLLVVRSFVIYHDYEHHSILQKSFIARVIMTIFGIYILAPASIWKRSHDYHHNHNSKLFTADIGSFPIVTKRKFFAMSKSNRFMYLAIRHPLNILFGYITIFALGMCVRSFLSSPKKHYDSLLALIIHIVGSVLVIHYFGWITWLLAVYVPFFIACGLGTHFFDIDVHNMLYFAPFGLLFNAIAFGATLIYFLLSSKDILAVGHNGAEYFALIFFVLCGTSIVTSFNTLLMLFLGIEIISIPLYILTGAAKRDLKSNEASLKYFLMGAFSTGLMLLGIAFLYGATPNGSFFFWMTWL